MGGARQVCAGVGIKGGGEAILVGRWLAGFGYYFFCTRVAGIVGLFPPAILPFFSFLAASTATPFVPRESRVARASLVCPVTLCVPPSAPALALVSVLSRSYSVAS